MTWKVISGGPQILAKQMNALGDKLLEIFPLDKTEGRAHHILAKIDGEIPPGIFHDETDNLVLPGGNITTNDVVVDVSKYEEEIGNLTDALADCKAKGEAEAQEKAAIEKKLVACEKKCTGLQEKLNKKAEDVEKFKEELGKVKAALKALE